MRQVCHSGIAAPGCLQANLFEAGQAFQVGQSRVRHTGGSQGKALEARKPLKVREPGVGHCRLRKLQRSQPRQVAHLDKIQVGGPTVEVHGNDIEEIIDAKGIDKPFRPPRSLTRLSIGVYEVPLVFDVSVGPLDRGHRRSLRAALRTSQPIQPPANKTRTMSERTLIRT